MAPMDAVGSVQEQMGNVRREMDILMNQKEMLKTRNIVTEMKGVFEALISIRTWLSRESLSWRECQ